MQKLKTLSGREVIVIFAHFGFSIDAQRGSHAKLRRLLSGGSREILTIPIHDELDKGTLKAIYRQALRYIPESELQQYFYH